jgi:kinesin family protein 6/9
MGRKNVKVLVRTRPTAAFAQDQLVVDLAKAGVRVQRRGVGGAGAAGGEAGSPGSPVGSPKAGEAGEAVSNQRESWDFEFDKVLHNASQQEVFDESGAEVVESVCDGVNGTIMAYGQTGSGKTFTMTGDSCNFKQRGVTPRALALLFSLIEDRPQHEFDVSLSYMEIYNERIFDLLSEGLGEAEQQQQGELQVVEDPSTRSMQVRGLTVQRVRGEEEALDVLFRGDQNRIVAEHQLNKRSNRSHSILTVHVEQRSRVRSDLVLRSKLNLVDLAGSERLKKAQGNRVDESLRKESAYINKSLTFLEQCVVALTGPSKRQHIPYRQTKLTNVLKDSMGGNCHTVLIACISGESRHLEETISTLKLAQRMRRVENAAASNEQTNPALLLKRYERQVAELKQELLMRDAIGNRASGVSYDDLSPDEVRDIAQRCLRFVEAAPGDEQDRAALKITSVRYANECFRQLKLLVRSAEARAEERARRAPQKGGPERAGDAAHKASGRDSQRGAIGELDGQDGFALGEAPALSRPAAIEVPAHARAAAPRAAGAGAGGEGHAEDGPATPTGHLGSVVTPGSPTSDAGELEADTFASLMDAGGADGTRLDRERAFKVFGAGEGAALQRAAAAASRALKTAAPQLQQARRSLKDTQAELESAKTQLEAIRGEQQRSHAEAKVGGARRATPAAAKDAHDEPVIDEEEFQLLRRVKDLKKQCRVHREQFDAAQAAKGERAAALAAAQEQLLDRFQIWYTMANRMLEEKMGDADKLDFSEQFDRLELSRVQGQDPQSVAFFKAAKAQRERERRAKKTPQQSRRV